MSRKNLHCPSCNGNNWETHIGEFASNCVFLNCKSCDNGVLTVSPDYSKGMTLNVYIKDYSVQCDEQVVRCA